MPENPSFDETIKIFGKLLHDKPSEREKILADIVRLCMANILFLPEHERESVRDYIGRLLVSTNERGAPLFEGRDYLTIVQRIDRELTEKEDEAGSFSARDRILSAAPDSGARLRRGAISEEVPTARSHSTALDAFLSEYLADIEVLQGAEARKTAGKDE